MSNNRTSKTTKSTSPEAIMARRKSRRKNRGSSDPADWGGCDQDLLQGLVAIVTGVGATITLGYTKDGGAYYVNYYIDGESDKLYIRPTEGIDAVLEAEIESWK